MRAILRAFLILLLFAQAATCQTSSASPRPSSPGDPSPELVEASRLAQSVVSLYSAGKFEEALPIAKRVVQIRERLLPKDDDKVVSAVLNLAEVQLSRGEYDDGQRFFERALHSYERTLGTDSLKLVGPLDRLALVYYRLGRPADTESAYRRALAIREQALGAEHLDVRMSLRNLAEFYQFEGDYKKSEPLYLRLIENKTNQGSSESIADDLKSYACLLRKTRREHDAEDMETRALEIINQGGKTERLVSAGVVNGKALSLSQPPYPYEARAAQVSGKVSVRVLINESGFVIRACAIDGPRLLMKVSERAAYQSRFSPTTVDGKPVRVTGLVIYNFVRR